jgi:hypothetical protein
MDGFANGRRFRTVAHRMLEVRIAHPQDPLAESARMLEPAPLEAEYEQASLFFVALAEGRAVGMIRVIHHSPAGLRTLNALGPVPGLDPLSAWDIASVVHEDPEVGFALYHAFLHEGLRQGVYAAVALVPEDLAAQLNAAYGRIFLPIGGRGVLVRLRQVPAILAANPPLYQRIVLGEGFGREVSFPGRSAPAPASR